MRDEEMVLKIQALVDNELPEDQIPGVINTIQADYEYRQEYAELLQLKRRMADVQFPALPQDWYAPFVRSPGKRVFLTLGSIFGGIGVAVFLVFQVALGLDLITGIPQWGRTLWIVSVLLGVVHFLIHAFRQKRAEDAGKSYKEIIR
ncbi:hypothetical protein [Spirochaeta lutea]|uniref:Uncharacterized protein n=1 Tax=Spirochaeta lutea TaxID=1480694 RepID=A0A098R132_9SPIO|nr:hypothetical protein [Spirochaeta lutea]KGE73486.1 hypothetical protein DC28_03285 [Spirochaeta lutea]